LICPDWARKLFSEVEKPDTNKCRLSHGDFVSVIDFGGPFGPAKSQQKKWKPGIKMKMETEKYPFLFLSIMKTIFKLKQLTGKWQQQDSGRQPRS